MIKDVIVGWRRRSMSPVSYANPVGDALQASGSLRDTIVRLADGIAGYKWAGETAPESPNTAADAHLNQVQQRRVFAGLSRSFHPDERSDAMHLSADLNSLDDRRTSIGAL
ncbi:hypothetical protein [Sphingobium xanthum]|uniref:hypothetical protein n=1 Tax=Sphingobium xanthum TaxID=1387165 RepID=UPI0015EC1E1C|nr:hypothetical protein [Sphingobium xanthum]MCW2364454.1 hypothetical protein [Sphingobium sp. B10D3B]MCW2402149.1 hypothetical protein [Sphingobium sp. B10D7B]MCW2409128.1 hypothetical protein [Sphingobium xanthum]